MKNYWEIIDELQTEIKGFEETIAELEDFYVELRFYETETMEAIEARIIELRKAIKENYARIEALRFDYRMSRRSSCESYFNLDIRDKIEHDGFVVAIKL